MLAEIFMTSIAFYISYLYRESKRREFDLSVLDRLEEIADNLSSGDSIDTSISKIIEKRKDRTARFLKRVVSKIKTGTSFEIAMKNAAKKEKSRLLENISAILALSEKSSGDLADILRLLSNQLRDIYILKLERSKKTEITTATLYLLGAFAMPFLITYINKIFDITTNMYLINFLIAAAVISAMISAAAKGTMTESLYLAPMCLTGSLLIISLVTGSIPYFSNMTIWGF